MSLPGWCARSTGTATGDLTLLRNRTGQGLAATGPHPVQRPRQTMVGMELRCETASRCWKKRPEEIPGIRDWLLKCSLFIRNVLVPERERALYDQVHAVLDIDIHGLSVVSVRGVVKPERKALPRDPRFVYHAEQIVPIAGCVRSVPTWVGRENRSGGFCD